MNKQELKEQWLERIQDMSKEKAIQWLDDLLFNYDMIDYQTSQDRLNVDVLNEIKRELEATDE